MLDTPKPIIGVGCVRVCMHVISNLSSNPFGIEDINNKLEIIKSLG